MIGLMESQLADLRTVHGPLAPRRYGRICSCDGGLIQVSGLPVPIGSLCRILTSGPTLGPQAEVIGFRGQFSLMMLLGDTVMLHPGALVRAEGEPGTVAVGEAFLGRAIDATGAPIDGGKPIRSAARWALGGRREGALERSSVIEPFDCGVRAMNALTTMGIGQRLGIIAGSGVGKSVLLDMIAGGCESEIAVVALIGERAREVSDFVSRHMTGPMRRRMVIIAVPADHAANLRLRGAQLAASMAEYFRAQGRQVTLIMDSLTRVAHAAREIGLLLGEPGAARGYPPSALAAVTKLVERAGNSSVSGGSITGIYTVLADGDDPDDPVVDSARAILDGHIVLSRELAQQGQYPAIDVTASLSRVMDGVTSREHQKNAREFRSLVAQYQANRDLVLMGAYREGADAGIDRAIAMHDRLREFLIQPPDKPVSLAESIEQLALTLTDRPPV
ncbi:FliI/YscN family ATPase [Allopontixanthobacter sediminis]|uniref:Flagellum-specific ATP synthase n=1 Tax=Allopontixanthobacter sediminis TaxID=1689985 RepID=A0A845B627_9SPHN|nr:FliI/YscN family ATPase [Allopontixanthobacter sediminis]MXP44952.1 FliI/YscN family ATPase [Allopontixanthobacter sediminis]